MSNLKEQIEARRQELGISQSELGERANYTKSAISRALHSEYNLRFETAQRLAEALGCEIHIELVPKRGNHKKKSKRTRGNKR